MSRLLHYGQGDIKKLFCGSYIPASKAAPLQTREETLSLGQVCLCHLQHEHFWRNGPWPHPGRLQGMRQLELAGALLSAACIEGRVPRSWLATITAMTKSNDCLLESLTMPERYPACACAN